MPAVAGGAELSRVGVRPNEGRHDRGLDLRYLAVGRAGALDRGECAPVLDQIREVRLVEEPSRLQAVHQKMAEKYGWANDFVALMSGDRNKSLALRIVDRGPG